MSGYGMGGLKAGGIRPRALARGLAQGASPEVWVRFPRLLGDVLFTLPFFHSLQAAWDQEAARAGARLAWIALGRASGAGLFSEAEGRLISELRLDERCGKIRPLAQAAAWRKGRPPVAVVTLGQSARLAAAAWLGDVPVRAGISDNGLGLLYHASSPYRGQTLHLAARLEALSSRLGVAGPCFRRLSPELLGGRSGLAKLRHAGWDGWEPLVVLAPGSRAHGKRWNPEGPHWTEVARLLAERGMRPVVLGTAEEGALASAIKARVPRTLDLTGQTSLPEAAAVLETAGAAVAVDTGLAHLAAATGCATVTLFGPSHEWFAQPVGPWSLALRGQPVPMVPGDGLPAGSYDPALGRLQPGRVAAALDLLRAERREAGLIAQGA